MSTRPIVPGFRDKTVNKAARDAADPSRNTHKEKGAPVTANEIAAYRLPLHDKCRRGKGLTVLEAAGDLPRRAVPCKCAMKRFLKAHPEIIVERTGAVYWPAPEVDGEHQDDLAGKVAAGVDRAMGAPAAPPAETAEEPAP